MTFPMIPRSRPAEMSHLWWLDEGCAFATGHQRAQVRTNDDSRNAATDESDSKDSTHSTRVSDCRQ